jgi:hypothetical protein
VGRAGGQVEQGIEVGDVLQPILRWQSADDVSRGPGGEQRSLNVVQLVGVLRDDLVDEGPGQRPCAGQRCAERGGPIVLQQLSRVLPVREEQVSGVGAAGGELPVGAGGGLAAGPVVVSGHDDLGPAVGQVAAELVGLPVGERSAEGGDTDDLAVTGQGGGDRVDRPLDEGRAGAGF